MTISHTSQIKGELQLSKLIWRYDEKGFMIGKEGIEVADNYVPKDKETDIRPKDKLIPPLQFVNNDWHGQNATDYINQLEKDADINEQLSQFALQQAQFQVSQQKLNSQLALQLATLTAKEAQNV